MRRPRRAVGAGRGGADCTDRLPAARRSVARSTTVADRGTPSSRRRHAEHPADRRDRNPVVGELSRTPGRPFRNEVLPKYALARLKISFSISRAPRCAGTARRAPCARRRSAPPCGRRRPRRTPSTGAAPTARPGDHAPPVRPACRSRSDQAAPPELRQVRTCHPDSLPRRPTSPHQRCRESRRQAKPRGTSSLLNPDASTGTGQAVSQAAESIT